MKEVDNVRVRGLVRVGIGYKGAPVRIPWDMPDDEARARFGKAIQQGVASRLVPGAGQVTVGVEGEGGGEEPIQRKMIIQAPPSVQAWPVGPAGAVKQTISKSLSGPTWLTHVTMQVVDGTVTVIDWVRAGVHVSQSRDVAAFAGDIVIFESLGTNTLGSLGDGPAFTLQAPFQGSNTAPMPFTFYQFFPRVFIPYRTFYLNFSWIITGSVTGTLTTVDFEPAELYEGEQFGLQTIQPRWVAPPLGKIEPRPREVIQPSIVYVDRVQSVSTEARAPAVPKAVVAPAKPKVAVEEFFKSYADIKVAEATGGRVVWSTIRNTGQGGWGTPLAVKVVR